MQHRPEAPESDARFTQAVAFSFTSIVAERIQSAHQVLASRWLDQLKRVLPLPESDIFPGEALLGHMPALIFELGDFLSGPGQEALRANAVVTARAMELGRLRHAQRASVHQVLREYHILRTVILRFIEAETARLILKPSTSDLFQLTHRLDAAVDVLLQTTVDTFVAEYTETINQHAERLERFSSTVSHELRQPLATLQLGLKALGTEGAWSNRQKRDRVIATCDRNVTLMRETLEKVVSLLRTSDGGDNALVQRLDLAAVVGTAVRQLRDMAEPRGVHVRIGNALPTITTDVARLELVLVNLISNGIKYSDPDKPVRLVEISAAAPDRPDTCRIVVRDNGIGIADSELRSIFGRFYRGHADRDNELGNSGLGLGLSIVADCVDALKGDIRVESTLGEGTTFILELPVMAPA